MDAILICAINLIAAAILIWRVEKIKDDVRDDIAAIERIKDLDDCDGDVITKDFEWAKVFSDGSEK